MASIAIDFGSTNTLVGIYSSEQNNKVICLEAKDISVTYDNTPVIPSVYTREGAIGLKAAEYPGKGALRIKRLTNAIQNFMFRFGSADYMQAELKRNIYSDIKSHLYKRGESNEYKKVLHLFLSELRRMIEKEVRITKVLFSYPIIKSGKQGDHYQKHLKQVAERVFEKIPVELADEVVCSAVGYGLNLNETQRICIVDIGGSTTSFSVCELQKQRNVSFVIVRESYDFGGRNIDKLISEDIETDSRLSEKIKIALSENEEYEYDGVHYSQTEFENLLSTAGVFERMESAIENLENKARNKGLGMNQISRVVFVGGTTKIPSVRKAVQDKFSAFHPDMLFESGSVFDAVVKGGAFLSAGIRFDPHLNYYYGLKIAASENNNTPDYKIFLWKEDSILNDNGNPNQVRLLVRNLWGTYQSVAEITVYEFEGEDVEQYFEDNTMDYKVINDESKRLAGHLTFTVDKPENILCFSFNEQKELFLSKNEDEKQKIGIVR